MSVQVLLNGIEAVGVLTLMILKWRALCTQQGMLNLSGCGYASAQPYQERLLDLIRRFQVYIRAKLRVYEGPFEA